MQRQNKYKEKGMRVQSSLIKRLNQKAFANTWQCIVLDTNYILSKIKRLIFKRNTLSTKCDQFVSLILLQYIRDLFHRPLSLSDDIPSNIESDTDSSAGVKILSCPRACEAVQ